MMGEMQDAGWSKAEIRDLMAVHPLIAGWMAEKGLSRGAHEFNHLWNYNASDGHARSTALGALPAVDGLSSADPMPRDRETTAMAASGGGGVLPTFSDEALARRMAERHATGRTAMRHVAAWGRWMTWDGSRWREDDVMGGLAAARAICSEAAVEAPGKDAKSIASARAAYAVEGLARADARIASRVDEWDRDPWLLATPAGTVDLRTGRTRTSAPSDMLTRSTRTAPDLHAGCPRWLDFLDAVSSHDRGMQAYLQRMAGYCLTGITSEDALFFLYGSGGNGKSTFVDTLTWVLGEEGYAQTVSIETFAASRGDRHLTELARLRGARLVSTSETEEGRGWNEARIKMVTGGSPITANFMRQDYFTFTPEFKLVVSGNHKPRIRTPDIAFRRRMNLVPFEVRIADDAKDKDLAEKLRGEAGGILEWMVQGCLQWQRVGLNPPDRVSKATDAYVADEDSRSTWFAECVRERTADDVDGGVREMDLFMSWRLWAEKGNEFVGNRRSLADWMHAHGHATGLTKYSQKCYPGLTLSTATLSALKHEKDNATNKPTNTAGLLVLTGGRSE